MRACSALVFLLVVFPLASCGKSESTANSSAPSSAPPPSKEPGATEPAPPTPVIAPTTTEIKKVDTDGPEFKLGEYLPPLDDGKIEIAQPLEWNLLPRDSKYLVRFYNEGRNVLPRIDITVEENDLGGLTTVTEANVAEFTAAVAKELEAKGTAVVEPPIPMVIGAVPCARYVSHVKLKLGLGTDLVERQTLALLHAGRLYKINLLVDLDKLLASRDAAYAICSGIRFLEAVPPAAAEPAAAPEPSAATN